MSTDGAALRTIPVCRECGHWRELEEGWGVCQLTQINEQQEPVDEFAMAYVYGESVDEETALMTWAKFGCTQHTDLVDPKTHEPIEATP